MAVYFIELSTHEREMLDDILAAFVDEARRTRDHTRDKGAVAQVLAEDLYRKARALRDKVTYAQQYQRVG